MVEGVLVFSVGFLYLMNYGVEDDDDSYLSWCFIAC